MMARPPRRAKPALPKGGLARMQPLRYLGTITIGSRHVAFTLDRMPMIVQEPGVLGRLGDFATPLAAGRPVLLVADPGLAGLGITASAVAALRKAGLAVEVFDALASDPGLAQIDAAAAAARVCGAALVVALGGGSALDVGKAAAAIAPAPAPASHYRLCAEPLPARALAKICIPTTSGTGSEATRTVVASDDTGAKTWLWGDSMKADVVLLDPELTLSLPPGLTGATGIDALVHAMEACTNRNANAGNDVFCHAAIRLVARHLPDVMANPGDLTARAGLQYAACLAGIGIDNTGTALAHNIGHAIGTLAHLHHGRAVALAMQATLGWVSAEDPDGRFAAIASLLGGNLLSGFAGLVRIAGIAPGIPGITPAALAAEMAAPDNAPMRNSTRREVRDADLLPLAEMVLRA